ncbi:hypothetical protein CBA19CS91_07930 [Paraburkholderia hospita]|jgi:hypothetical protein|nr:hypothetical protein CBA19CS91_07930 [Paraburkholderia hospita]
MQAGNVALASGPIIGERFTMLGHGRSIAAVVILSGVATLKLT